MCMVTILWDLSNMCVSPMCTTLMLVDIFPQKSFACTRAVYTWKICVFLLSSQKVATTHIKRIICRMCSHVVWWVHQSKISEKSSRLHPTPHLYSEMSPCPFIYLFQQSAWYIFIPPFLQGCQDSTEQPCQTDEVERRSYPIWQRGRSKTQSSSSWSSDPQCECHDAPRCVSWFPLASSTKYRY